VGNWGDHGLSGFALHPNYETNGLIYLQYVVDRHHLLYFGTASYSATTNSYDNATIQRVTRYKTTFNTNNEVVADAASRFILIGESKTTGIPVTHSSHSGGMLAFGRDTTLLISTGDGASYSNFIDTGNNPTSYWQQALTDGIIRSNENRGAYRSQMVNSFNGKVLRIDPITGDGIPSNPFYLTATPRAPQSRVWAMGFRNPFRFSVKPNSGSTDRTAANPGDLYVGDVGNSNWEELNIINAPGQNCGWPLFEGIVTTIDPANDYYGAIKSLNNYDEQNPLFGIGGCTQRYFTFQNLLKQATADNNTTVYNPCSSTTPITGTIGARYFHRVAAIDWYHWNNTSRVKYFSGNTISAVQIGTTSSGVTGSPFLGNSSSGGCWYTGSMFPSSYKNTFFLADYGGNWIQNLTMDATVTDKVRNVVSFASGYSGIIQIVENPLDGSLYTVDIINQNILRIIYGNGNLAPTAKVGADKTYGPSSLTVNFNSTGSKDPEGGALTYSWNFGDGTALSTAANPSHTFSFASNPKKFVVYLTVKDNQNATALDSIIISVNNTPPSVNFTSPVKNSYYNIGPDTTYTLSATVSDAEHNSSQLFYKWQVFLHHNLHEHPEPIDTNKTTSITLSRPDNTATDTFYWMIYLSVTDAAGLTTYDSSKLSPITSYKVPPNITVHPQSQTACEGNAVTFTSSVSNSPLPSIQWQESTNGTTWVNITGANSSSYTFNSLLTDNNKKYRAIWTNSGGSATSNAATLTVNASPAAPTGQATQSFSVSATVANLQATGTAVKWYAASSGGTALASTTALSSGTHYYASQTVSGCESVQRLDVTAYIVTSPLSAAANAAAVTCAGLSNGSVTVSASGGISPYQYSINGGTTYQSSNSFSNLAAGAYTVTVKDYINATTLANATVTQPTAISFTTQKTDISCSTAYGTITVSASGGTPGYAYSKDNGTSYQIGTQFNSLASGTYALRVKDTNNCVATAQSVSIVNSSATTATLNAGGSSGTISSYAWRLVSGPSIPVFDSTKANTTISQLVSGTYIFQLSLNGGASTSRVNVVVNPPTSPLTAHAGYDRVVNLPVDTVVLDGNGSTGSITAYDWALISTHTVNPSFTATEVAPVVRGLQEGTYRFRLGVKDAFNTIVARDTVQITVNPLPVTAPVIAAVNNKASNTNTVTNSLSAVPAKALLVLTLAQGDDFTTAPHASVSSTPALTWTKRADADAPGSGNAEIYTAVFNAGGKISITSVWGTKPISASAYVITGYDTLLGNNLSLFRDSQSVVSVPVNTSLRNSLIIAVSADKKGLSGTGRTYLDAATETQYHTKSAVYTGYHYRKLTTAKGLYTEGISKPTGLMAGTAVLEVRGILNTGVPLNAHAGYNQTISCPAPVTGLIRPVAPAGTEIAAGPVVKVYPNPGNGWFHLSIAQATGGSGYLKVFDARGVVVLQKSLNLLQGKNQFEIPLHNKPNGIYYFRLQHAGRSIILKVLKY
ncbi:MAG: hypothetical protein RL732_1216, partial [Bacteroidota bacterium]